MIVKKMDIFDYPAYAKICANAYPGFKMTNLEKIVEHFTTINEEDKTTAFYGVYKDSQLLGGMRLHDFKANIYSNKLLAGGIGLVAVDLLHKKEGAAKKLLEEYINIYRDKGASLGVLYPFRPDFYYKMGFGYGTQIHHYSFSPDALPRGKSKEHIKFLDKNDWRRVFDCYQRYAGKTHGMIEQTEFGAQRMMKSPANLVIGYEDEGKILGYLNFTFKPGHDKNVLDNDIFINEMVYENRDVLMEFCTFLNTQFDQVPHINIVTHDDCWYHLLSDPRNKGNNLIPIVYHETNLAGMGIMYKVIDIKKFFKDLKSHSFGGQNLTVRFNIEDSFTPENNNPVIIKFKDGKPTLTRSKSFDVELKMSIADFSSVAVGALPFKKAYEYGKVELSDIAYTDTLHRLFCAEHKPVCTTQF